PIQMIPAISYAVFCVKKTYTYPLKPEEEQQLRRKVLVLAADEVRARHGLLAPGTLESASSARRSPRQGKTAPGVKTLQPNFEDVQLRIFDLSKSNVAVLVLNTYASMNRCE